MDVIEEEATEDIEKMAAMIPSEKSYMRMQPCVKSSKSAIPWLTAADDLRDVYGHYYQLL